MLTVADKGRGCFNMSRSLNRTETREHTQRWTQTPKLWSLVHENREFISLILGRNAAVRLDKAGTACWEEFHAIYKMYFSAQNGEDG